MYIIGQILRGVSPGGFLNSQVGRLPVLVTVSECWLSKCCACLIVRLIIVALCVAGLPVPLVHVIGLIGLCAGCKLIRIADSNLFAQLLVLPQCHAD